MNTQITLPSLTQRLARSEGLICNDVGMGVIFLDANAGQYYGATGVGYRVWQLAERPTTIAELVARLLEQYEVDEATCREEVSTFVAELLDAGVLQVLDEDAAQGAASTTLPSGSP